MKLKLMTATAVLLSSSLTHSLGLDVGAVNVPLDRVSAPEIKPLLVEYMGLLSSDGQCAETSMKCKAVEQSLLNVLNTPEKSDTEVATKD